MMPCPYDTDGDGDCGQRGCPVCGGGPNPYKDWTPYHVLEFVPCGMPSSPPKAILPLHKLLRRLMFKLNARWN